jgi:type IV pilus assembly protein PilN
MASMRAPINLASEPFRKDRALTAISYVLAGVLTVLLVFLITMVVSQRNQMAGERAEVAKLEEQLSKLTSERTAIEATLRKPENEVVFERNVLLNTLILRKGISWTRIFADLEKVMPGNVRLIAVRLPQINNQNRVLLDMTVGAQDQGPILDLLKRLESSPVFGATTVHTFQPPSQNEPLYRYRVSVSYAQKL